jgi:hypothetical protein
MFPTVVVANGEDIVDYAEGAPQSLRLINELKKGAQK